MRIIGGQARGRRLATPPRARGLRPTTDRVREALFGILTARWDLDGVEVLDLYAGTGALGCEALSRGAARAVFVDHSRAATRTIAENLRRIDHPHQEIIAARVLPTLRTWDDPGRFDIVFMDPPYADQLVSATLQALDQSALLLDGATIIADHHPDEPLPAHDALQRLTHITTRTHGGCCLSMWERTNSDDEDLTP